MECTIHSWQSSNPNRECPYCREAVDNAGKTDSRIEAAYDAGYIRAVSLYAVWKDGQQLVGIMQKPLSEVIAAGPDPEFKAMDLEELRNDRS